MDYLYFAYLNKTYKQNPNKDSFSSHFPQNSNIEACGDFEGFNISTPMGIFGTENVK